MPRLFSRLLLLVALLAGWSAPAAALETFEVSQVTVQTATGGKYKFTVELATTPRQVAQGLMFRDRLPEDAGMLFLYDRERLASFWMKNTLIPLDMLFIAGNGRIVNIHDRAVPGSLEPVSSAAPVKGVLEINGGLAARLGIRPGDRVVHPAFK